VTDLPTTMQALVVRAPSVLEMNEVPVPAPGLNQVLARVRAVSICGTDAHLIHGDYPGFWPPAFPFIPGHEWAGEIVALGPGADGHGWKVGDRVAGTSHDACGVCQKCVEGRYNLCENYGRPGLHRQYGHNTQGADATYVVQGVKTIFRLPDGLSFDEGALVDPASIALHVAVRGGVRPGDTVAITGAGPSVFRAGALENALKTNFAPEAARAVTIPADDLNTDLHASAEYRAHLIPVLAARAVARANG